MVLYSCETALDNDKRTQLRPEDIAPRIVCITLDPYTSFKLYL